MPVTTTAWGSTPAPATPSMRERLLSRPSFMPKMAARTEPARPPPRCQRSLEEMRLRAEGVADSPMPESVFRWARSSSAMAVASPPCSS